MKEGVTLYVDVALDSIITYAITISASDIHFDPIPDGVQVRLRIDGLLTDYMFIDATDADMIVNRIKVSVSYTHLAGELKGILGVSDVPLVSCDFSSDPRSSIVDADLTMVMDGNMVKVVSWYDNEWGYSERLIDMAAFVASKGL